jgi:hypothetical protein
MKQHDNLEKQINQRFRKVMKHSALFIAGVSIGVLGITTALRHHYSQNTEYAQLSNNSYAHEAVIHFSDRQGESPYSILIYDTDRDREADEAFVVQRSVDTYRNLISVPVSEWTHYVSAGDWRGDENELLVTNNSNLRVMSDDARDLYTRVIQMNK